MSSGARGGSFVLPFPRLIRSIPLFITAAALACSGGNLDVPTTGSVQVTTATSGADPDPNGYAIAVDGSDRGTAGASGTMTVEGLTPGDHLVGLNGVAGNCQVQGDNPRTASVTAGATATAAFAITCTTLPANAGTLQITTTTSGPNPDPNGYTVSVDGGATQPIVSNGTLPISGIAAAAHTVSLTGVAPNCAVTGDNTITITVTAGQTATAAFAITCTAAAQARIVFVRGGDVFTVNPDGTGRTRLTDGRTVSAETPQWSPDRSKIVFEGGPDGGDIYVIGADGSGLRNLTNTSTTIGGGRETIPKWSPDGSRILFSKTTLLPPDGDVTAIDLYTMSADGGVPVRLTATESELAAGGYDWSPNGAQIAFESVRGGSQGIYVVDASGGAATKLSTAGDFGAPNWSPDGSKIVFLSQPAFPEPWQVWTMNSNGSGQAQRTNQPGDIKTAPSWSPDGGKIVYMNSTSAGSSDIWTINADGSGALNVTGNGADNDSPVWSPDSRQIAFVVGLGTGGADAATVWSINVDGTGAKNVSTLAGYRPDW
jgi:Tol biopolymer transport system component